MNKIDMKYFTIWDTNDIEEVDDSTVRAVIDSIAKNLCIKNSIYVVKIENCTGAGKIMEKEIAIQTICFQFGSMYNTIICTDASTIFDSDSCNPETPNDILKSLGFENIGGDVMVYGAIGRNLIDSMRVE